MAVSTRTFDRWKPHQPNTLAFQIHKQYSTELAQMIGSHRASFQFSFAQLKKNGADLADPTSAHFDAKVMEFSGIQTIDDWQVQYNKFDNWIGLSEVMTIASNLETYVASVVSLAIESDPGVLLASARAFDGARNLKYGKQDLRYAAENIAACTRGDWSKRLAAFEALFGPCPKSMRDEHASLEKIRGIRNRFGHAFGRDIEDSRKHGQIKIDPMEKVSRKTAASLGRAAWRFARVMDKKLLQEHIGDYEALAFYSNLVPNIRGLNHNSDKAAAFKKAIGQFGAGLRGKKYSKSLVDYWDAL